MAVKGIVAAALALAVVIGVAMPSGAARPNLMLTSQVETIAFR